MVRATRDSRENYYLWCHYDMHTTDPPVPMQKPYHYQCLRLSLHYLCSRVALYTAAHTKSAPVVYREDRYVCKVGYHRHSPRWLYGRSSLHRTAYPAASAGNAVIVDCWTDGPRVEATQRSMVTIEQATSYATTLSLLGAAVLSVTCPASPPQLD